MFTVIDQARPWLIPSSPFAATTHHQDGAVRQRTGIAVIPRMQLADGRVDVCGQARGARCGVATHGRDEVARFDDTTVVQVCAKPHVVVNRCVDGTFDAAHRGVFEHPQFALLDVAPQVARDLWARRQPARVVAVGRIRTKAGADGHHL